MTLSVLHRSWPCQTLRRLCKYRIKPIETSSVHPPEMCGKELVVGAVLRRATRGASERPLYGTCARPAKALESPPHDAFLLIQRLHRIPIMPPPPNADCLQNHFRQAVRRCGIKINWLLSLGIIIFGCLMSNAFATWPSQVDGPTHSFSQQQRRTLP